MDSGNEVIIVDDSVLTTNGINGSHEDIPEMKTRSKVGDEESVKPKLRSTRTTSNAQKNVEEKVEKVNSDNEKKDKKINLRESDIKSSGKEISAVRNTQQDSKTSGIGISGTAKKGKIIEEEKFTGTPVKKKIIEREDDSGINSRASSVSNEEAIVPRMRTRSSKTSEILSTSTPTYKKGQGRMPLSTYEFDDITFDDDLPSNSLKRKAVLYIEEMDDEEENKEGNDEPIRKRSTVGERGTSFVTTLINPFRLIRGKFSSGFRTSKLETSPIEDDNSDLNEEKANGDDINIENEESSGNKSVIQAGEEKTSSTCSVM